MTVGQNSDNLQQSELLAQTSPESARAPPRGPCSVPTHICAVINHYRYYHVNHTQSTEEYRLITKKALNPRHIRYRGFLTPPVEME